MKWAQQDKNARPTEWARRLSFVRGFARHWSAHDSRTEVPPPGLLPYRPGRARPYLYSNEEIRKLLQAARRLPSAHGLRGPTYYSLLGLLAVTGLRISEARNLQTEDVDLKKGILTIRGSQVWQIPSRTHSSLDAKGALRLCIPAGSFSGANADNLLRIRARDAAGRR